jgi:molybdate transport system substrate-binding protein
MTIPARRGYPAPAAVSTAALVLVAALLTACGSGSQSTSGGSSPGASKLSGTVVVFAAASLTHVFEQIGNDFERAHPGVSVRFNFGASSALAQQITQGAPADVFSAASPNTMELVTRAGDAADEPTVFVKNRLQIAVPTGNPGRVSGLADFGKADLKLALCAPQVPCGAAAEKALKAAGVTAKPDTLEQDVKATVTKVALGEVDAALVYRTDVKAAGDKVDGIDFPEAVQAVNDYPIVVLEDAPNAAVARAFVEYVLSAQGRAALTEAGFDSP